MAFGIGPFLLNEHFNYSACPTGIVRSRVYDHWSSFLGMWFLSLRPIQLQQHRQNLSVLQSVRNDLTNLSLRSTCRPSHHLSTPVITIPCTNTRCAMKKIVSGRIIVMMDAARMSCGSELYRPLNSASPMLIGCALRLPARYMSGPK